MKEQTISEKLVDILHSQQREIDRIRKEKEELINFITQTQTNSIVKPHGHWVKNKPNPDAMNNFHKKGIGLSMRKNSIFWTCSECGTWGTPYSKFCSECGTKMDRMDVK